MTRTYSIIALCQACAAVATVLALRALAIYVPPEIFGQYTLYQSVVAAAGLFFVSWPNAAVLRFGRQEWTSHGGVGRTLAARTMLFVPSVALATALAWILDPWLRGFLRVGNSPFYWIVAGLIIVPGAELGIYVSQAVGRPQAYGYSPLITRGGFLLFAALIPLLGRPVGWTYLAGSLLVATLAAMSATILMLPRATWRGFGESSSIVGSLLRYSWALPFAALTTYVVGWVDTWVIRGVMGVAPVGVYNWAYQATAVAGLAFSPISAILTPRVIDARVSGDQDRIDRYARSILPATVLVAAAIALAMALLFPLRGLVASPAYAAGYPVILVLFAALPFQLLGYLVTPIGNAHERLLPKFVAAGAVVAVSNSIGDLLLVPRFGISGAAISTAMALGIGGLLQTAVVRRSGSFSALWMYTAPAWILIPVVVAVQAAGPLLAGAVALAVGLGVSGCVLRPTHREENRLSGALGGLRQLPRSLSLYDAAPPYKT